MNTRPLRILHLIDSMRLGGAQRLLVDIVTRAEPGRHQFEICCIQGGDAFRREFEALGCPLHVLGEGKYSLGAARRITDLCRRGQYDLVHGHLFQGCFWGGWVRRRGACRRFVAHLHSPLFPPPWSYMEGWSVRQADLMIPVSEATKQDFIRAYRLPGDNMRIVPNGIDTARFGRADRSRARTTLGIDPLVPLVGFVGRLARVKGIDVLLEAFRTVVAEIPEARLILIGDGAERDSLRSVAADLPVTFLGSRPDVPDLVPGFDVMAVPSRKEPFGIVALEGMACGVPIVASAAGGLVEVVAPGAGRLVPPEDPAALAGELLALLRDPEQRAGLGMAARDYAVERYDIANVIRGIEAVYKEASAMP